MNNNYHIDNNPDVTLQQTLPISIIDSYKIEGITRSYIREHQNVLNTVIKNFLASDNYKEMLDADKYYESQNVKISLQIMSLYFYLMTLMMLMILITKMKTLWNSRSNL